MEVDEGEWKWIKVNEGERNGIRSSLYFKFNSLLFQPNRQTNLFLSPSVEFLFALQENKN